MFPFLVSVVLIISTMVWNRDQDTIDIDWSSLTIVLISIIAFAVALNTVGLAVSIAAAVMILIWKWPARISNKLNTAVGISVFCSILFGLVLRLPVKLW